MINVFDDLPAHAHQEILTELILRKGVRIERIVSTGQSTPADKPYDQDHDEWVLLLTPARRVYGWKAKASAIFGPATMS